MSTISETTTQQLPKTMKPKIVRFALSFFRNSFFDVQSAIRQCHKQVFSAEDIYKSLDLLGENYKGTLKAQHWMLDQDETILMKGCIYGLERYLRENCSPYRIKFLKDGSFRTKISL